MLRWIQCSTKLICRRPLESDDPRYQLLACGRIALDDVVALAELRNMGLLARPKHRPAWLDRWSTLLPYFAFASFMDEVNLAPVEDFDFVLVRGALDPFAKDPPGPRWTRRGKTAKYTLYEKDASREPVPLDGGTDEGPCASSRALEHD